MRKYLFIAASFLFFVGTVFAMGGVSKQVTPDPADIAAVTPGNRVIVYYFHGNFRCTNCYNIEQYTKEAVDRYFKKEIKESRIVFQAVNVETKGNEHFVNDYQLYTKAVVLSLVKNGKETAFNNLVKVWENLRSKDAFQMYIKSEIEKYLKEL